MAQIPKQPRRRWFRYSLRTMFVVVTIFAVVIAIPLAWIAKERRQSRYELQVAERLGKQGFKGVILGGPYDSWLLQSGGRPQGWTRDLARHILGERILLVYGPPPGFNDLNSLRGLSSIVGLDITGTQIIDIAPLADIGSLQDVWLSKTGVSDLTPLAELRHMRTLWLYDSQIRDLSPLIGLLELTDVGANKTLVTKEQVEALQQALPNCKIQHDAFP